MNQRQASDPSREPVDRTRRSTTGRSPPSSAWRSPPSSRRCRPSTSRCPDIARSTARQRDPADLDRRRLLALLRRSAAAGRGARRPVRAPAHAADRTRDLRRRLARSPWPSTAHSELIALRAVLGLGAALVMPATLSTITGTFAAEQRDQGGQHLGRRRRRRRRARVSSPPALLLEVWSWRSIFALNVVLVLVAIVGTLRFVPESADPAAPRLDVPGALLAGLGLIVLVYSIIEAPTHGWASARTLGGLGAGLVVLAGSCSSSCRRRRPAARPADLRHRRRLSAGKPVDLRPVLRLLRLHLPAPAVPPARPRRLAAGVGRLDAADGRRR